MGVKLKKVCYSRTPIEYEMTPYEILMDDIRSRRYTLKKVDGAIPPRKTCIVMKPAHIGEEFNGVREAPNPHWPAWELRPKPSYSQRKPVPRYGRIYRRDEMIVANEGFPSRNIARWRCGDFDIEELSQPPTPGCPIHPARPVNPAAFAAIDSSNTDTPPSPPKMVCRIATNDQAAVREQLAQARLKREAALLKLRVAKCLRSAAMQLNNKYQCELLEIRDNCRQILREIEEETRWRPASVTMSQKHQRELIQRVANLQSLLAATSRSRRALPSEGPLGNSHWA
ncbi:hypothetical protein MSG28_006511 [Choristoneura fumiferana]|uniref:Uncharacterized protein n=1 Tax=Choristoneura fumiferana TaxID=7141 RepID=A0ACC0JF33_CHOFU|nr:hypothetical protein MSG28_006511 [Choristoneura fumiferana]